MFRLNVLGKNTVKNNQKVKSEFVRALDGDLSKVEAEEKVINPCTFSSGLGTSWGTLHHSVQHLYR